MVEKLYAKGSPVLQQSLEIALKADPNIPLAGVTVLGCTAVEATGLVSVIADVDPTPADAAIQAVIDAHDPDADFVIPEDERRRYREWPMIGTAPEVADLPAVTFDEAVAVVSGANSGVYAREGGAWVFRGAATDLTLITARATAQAGGNPAQIVESYTRLTGMVWEQTGLRSTGHPPWECRAFVGRLQAAGDRADFGAWSAIPSGGELGVIFLPAGTIPNPASASTIAGVWSGQWTGGFSVTRDRNRWRVRANGSRGSGFPNSGPRVAPGDLLSVSVNAAGRIEVRNLNNAVASTFSVGAGLDVWVVSERVDQRWSPAYVTTATPPTPGTPDADDETVAYVPTHALALDGVNDRVDIPNGPDIGDVLRWDSDWSIAIRLPSNAAVDTDTFQNIVCRGPFNAIGLNRNGGALRLHAFREGALYSGTFPDTDLGGMVVVFSYDASGDEFCVHIGDDLGVKVVVPTLAASADVINADLTVGAMLFSTTFSSYLYAWAGRLHELFYLGRLLTDDERADALRDPNLANHSWYGDVLGWLPLGTGDTYPTMSNLVVGASDGTLINATADTFVEV